MDKPFIQRPDLDELKRLATNAYDEEQLFLNRVINGIYAMEKEIKALRAEVDRLKED